MENESDIIESLTAIGYRGNCLQNDVLSEALNVGTKSEQFREVVAWIAYELHVLRKTDENLDKDTDFNEFAMELSALLKELGCPFKKFIDGPLSGRFQNKQSRIQLLEYLITELMTTKMCLKQKPLEDDSFVIPKFETNTARALESITKTLSLGKPPENIAPRALFDKLNFKLDEAKRNTNKQLVGESLMNSEKPLSEAQWKKLEDIQKNMDEEYNLRRQTLLTRLDVTVQSFQWSDRMKGNEDAISKKYQSKMKELDQCRFGGTETDIVALLAARDDLAIIEKTSSANVRKNTGTQIQKHVIGNVPDRGGRANEHAPPPPEMPSWQTQRSGGGGGGGGRGGFGGGGGGFRGGRGGNRGGGGGGGSWQQPSFQGGNYNSGSGGGGGGYQQSNQSNFGSNQGRNNFGSNQNSNYGSNQGGNFGSNQSGNFGSNQGSNFGSNQGGNDWLSGSGRVQGAGWQPRNDQSNNFNNSSFGDNRSDRGNFSSRSSFGGQQQNYQQGGGNYNRGRSNYNRGGGGGGGGGGGYRNN